MGLVMQNHEEMVQDLELLILHVLKRRNMTTTTCDLAIETGMRESKLNRILNQLCASQKIRKVGSYTSFNCLTHQTKEGYMYSIPLPQPKPNPISKSKLRRKKKRTSRFPRIRGHVVINPHTSPRY